MGAGYRDDQLVAELRSVLVPGLVFLKELERGTQLGYGEVAVGLGAAVHMVHRNLLAFLEGNGGHAVLAHIVRIQEAGDHHVVHAAACGGLEALNGLADREVHVAQARGVEFIVADGFGEGARTHGTACGGCLVQDGLPYAGRLFREVQNAKLVQKDHLAAQVAHDADVFVQPGGVLLKQGAPFFGVLDLIIVCDCYCHNRK